VSQTEEFRAYADECLAFARKAISPELRQTFLDMAQTWLRAAAELDGRAARSDRMTDPQGVSAR
jgi:hypothetical protein